jgi:hypothetical protein
VGSEPYGCGCNLSRLLSCSLPRDKATDADFAEIAHLPDGGMLQPEFPMKLPPRQPQETGRATADEGTAPAKNKAPFESGAAVLGTRTHLPTQNAAASSYFPVLPVLRVGAPSRRPTTCRPPLAGEAGSWLSSPAVLCLNSARLAAGTQIS